MANINVHGAFFMIFGPGPVVKRTRTPRTIAPSSLPGSSRSLIGCYATVDSAVQVIVSVVQPKTRADYMHLKSWAAVLAYNTPGTVDCYDSVWPIIWYDPDKDDCQFEVDDWEEWEAEWDRRGYSRP